MKTEKYQIYKHPVRVALFPEPGNNLPLERNAI